MKKIKEYKKITIVLIVVCEFFLILGAFYLFKIRPMLIRQDCWNYVGIIKNQEFNTPTFRGVGGTQDDFDLYNKCLKKKFLYKL